VTSQYLLGILGRNKLQRGFPVRCGNLLSRFSPTLKPGRVALTLRPVPDTNRELLRKPSLKPSHLEADLTWAHETLRELASC